MMAIADIHTIQHKLYDNAPTLVFLHDSLGRCTLWRDFPEKLSEVTGLNTFVYDRTGYGQSAPFDNGPRRNDYMEREAVILMDLLTEHKIERPVLFGHSDGGTIALLAAAKYKEYIRAVITEGAHVFVEEKTLEGILLMQKQYNTTNLRERLEKYHGNKTQAVFEAWTNIWLSPSYRDWNIEHFLSLITCPVLVIQGTNDEYGTEAQVDAIVEQVSGLSKKCMIINAGHTPHRQSELWVINACRTFLQQHKIISE